MKKILYVLHSGVTGGTFLTNKDLMKNVVKKYEVYLLSAENDFFRLFKYSKNELNLIKEYSRFFKLNAELNGSFSMNQKWSAKEFHNSWLTYIYFDILMNFEFDLIHIRHLINHSFDLPYVAKKLDIPVVLSIHDFYFLCPFYTLIDENNNYCAGICSNNHENCYVPMNSLSDVNSKEIISIWREEVLKMFEKVDYFVTTSNIVKNLFLSIFKSRDIINSNNFLIIEHGRDFHKSYKKYFKIPESNKPIKILCPANHLNLMKGSDLIKHIKDEDIQNKIEFHFLGNCHDGIEKYGINHGTYERDDFYKKVKEINPSFIGIFSIWPETFCHTITESWSCGIPVIGTNIGVIEERILKNNGGWIVNKNNPKQVYDDIIRISNDKEGYINCVKNIKKIKLKNTREMAKEYISLYELLIESC